jgi:hypothetical protein
MFAYLKVTILQQPREEKREDKLEELLKGGEADSDGS